VLRVVVLGAVLAAVALAVYSRPPERVPPLRLADGRLPNILLLTVDTLRADHLGYVGTGPSDLTPELDQVTRGGTAFVAASTPAPTTRAATAALLTGSYRGRHWVRGNGWSLGPDQPVVAEVLAAAGYRTAAFFGNGILDAQFGFGRGFETYESFAKADPSAGKSKDTEGVTRAIEWLEAGPAEPWFLWVHLMDPHGPYDSAPASVRATTSKDDPRPDKVLTRARRNTGLGVLPRYQAIPGVRRASVYRWRYRAEIRHMDTEAGRLLAALDERGLADETLVVLTADHGEGLGDGEYYFQHGWLADEGSIAIPLAFRLPGRVREGVVLDAAVSLVDVSPTLIGGLGLDVPGTMQGRDLSGALSASAPTKVASGPVFSASTLLSGISSVRMGPWKLVHTPGAPAAGTLENDPWEPYYETGESFRLFDLRTDPGETTDVSGDHPERTAELRALLVAWEREQRLHMGVEFDRPAETDPKVVEMLRSLGYVD